MAAHTGYYSLIQYCPDRGRAEAVNVGLVVFVPDTGKLEVRMTQSSKRIQQVFGKGAVDAWWLKTVRDSFESGLASEFRMGRFKVPSDLDQYFAGLGNDIMATPARVTRVEDARATLERLFARLVETTQPARDDLSIPIIARPIDEAFRRLRDRLVPVHVAQSYAIEGYPHEVRADYVYPNGDANLVRLLRIGESAARTFDHAVKLGGESVVVRKRLRIENRSARLIVVAAPLVASAKAADTEVNLGRLYQDFPEATWIASADIPQFADRVESEAH